MKKLFFLFLLLGMFSQSYAGDDAGNGGDTHLTTFLQAQGNASVILNYADALGNSLRIFSPDEQELIDKYGLSEWNRELQNAKFVQVKEMLYENGDEKAALSIPGTNLIHISREYYKKYAPSGKQVVALLIHEAGHKIQISDHSLLDKVGWKLAEHFYSHAAPKDPILKFMERLPFNMRKKLDLRLKEEAYKIIREGKGMELAFTLVDNAAQFLGDSHMSQMFKYMAYKLLNAPNILYPFKNRGEYVDYKTNLIKRLLTILVEETNMMKESERQRLVQYYIAKMVFIDRVWLGTGVLKFDHVVDAFTRILNNNQISNEQKVRGLREEIVNYIFTGTLFY